MNKAYVISILMALSVVFTGCASQQVAGVFNTLGQAVKDSGSVPAYYTPQVNPTQTNCIKRWNPFMNQWESTCNYH